MSADKDRKHSAAVVTVSDKGSAGEREDKSGRVVREMLEGAGIKVTRAELIPDDLPRSRGSWMNYAARASTSSLPRAAPGFPPGT